MAVSILKIYADCEKRPALLRSSCLTCDRARHEKMRAGHEQNSVRPHEDQQNKLLNNDQTKNVFGGWVYVVELSFTSSSTNSILVCLLSSCWDIRFVFSFSLFLSVIRVGCFVSTFDMFVSIFEFLFFVDNIKLFLILLNKWFFDWWNLI